MLSKLLAAASRRFEEAAASRRFEEEKNGLAEMLEKEMKKEAV